MKMVQGVGYGILLLAALASAYAQKEQKVERKNVPAAVLSSFTKWYPHAEIRGYSRESEHGEITFEIESVDGGMHRDILYTSRGKVVEVEETLPRNQVPEVIRTALSQQLRGVSIQRIERVSRDSSTRYEATIGKGKRARELVFDDQGNIVRKDLRKR
jgi:hypothetical protein